MEKSFTQPTVHSQGVEVLNRHDFWRACYATMLAEIKPEHIIEFFEPIPMVMQGKKYAGKDLLSLLWNEKGTVNMDWNFASIHPIEPFLIGKGYDALGFFRKMLHRNNRATYMPGKVLMSWLYPMMDTFFNVYDPREMVLKLITTYSEAYVPGILHRRVKRTVEGEWINTYMLFITHKNFNSCYVFNYDFIVGEQILAFPKIMDMPAFEGITFLNDCQGIGDVLWSGEVVRNDNGVWLDGRKIAEKPQRYHAFMDQGGYEIEKFNLPDRIVMVALEDISCPKRNRQVIYKGCAYESPAYLSVIRHKKVSNKDRKLLHHMLHDTMKEDELFSPEVIRRHEALMQSLEKKLTFAFYSGEESISVDGEHFIKGVPARILRNILIAVKNGKREFEYREFKRDFEISHGQKNSNFEIRFYRLIEKLDEKCQGLRIVKSDRGRFTVDSGCLIELEEHP